MGTRSHKIKARSDEAYALGIPGGGTITATFILHATGTQAPYASVTGEVANRNGRVMSCGQLHGALLEHWPELAALTQIHLCTPGKGPMHYEANALYWWEQGNAEHFKSTALWGVVDTDTDPVWTLPVNKANTALIRIVLAKRLPALLAHIDRVVADFALEA